MNPMTAAKMSPWSRIPGVMRNANASSPNDCQLVLLAG